MSRNTIGAISFGILLALAMLAITAEAGKVWSPKPTVQVCTNIGPVTYKDSLGAIVTVDSAISCTTQERVQ